MRKITENELKTIQQDILDKVHSFCEQKGITYFLACGTLIGAVRHRGYIPWDDDIDLFMPRKDYEEFINSFNGYIENYKVISLVTDSMCTIAYAKIERVDTSIKEEVDFPMELGVNIDLFPLDGVPDEERIRDKYVSKMRFLRNRMILKDVSVNFRRRGLLKNLVLIAGKIWLCNKSLHQLAVAFDAAIDKNTDDTLNVCGLVFEDEYQRVFSREAIHESIDIEFEGKTYKTMKGYDEYLSKTYGDYMQLPPTEKQVSHHKFEAYWKE